MAYEQNKVRLAIGINVKQLQKEVDSLLADLEIEYEKLLLGGMPEREAQARIASQVINNEGTYKAFTNRTNKLINAMVGNLVAQPINDYGQKNPNQLFEWVLEPGAEHCDDCLRMASLEPKTISEWRSEGVGLPREGKTICSYGCKCALTPTGE